MGRDSEQIARLAEEVAGAGDRLLKALDTENRIKRKRTGVGLKAVLAAQRVVDGRAERYMKAMRQYVESFQSAIEDRD